MAKGDQKQIQSNIRTQQSNANAEYDQFRTSIQPIRNDLYGRTGQDYDAARAGYANFASTGGISPEDMARLRGIYGAEGGGGGGASAGESALGGVNFVRNSAAGGVNVPDFGEERGRYRGFADTGGFSAEDLGNISRDTLKEFEKTGGYSATDVANIRSRSAASSPAFYSALKDQLGRTRATTGNLAGQGAIDFKLARQASQQANQDRVNTEIGLADSIRSGRMGASSELARNYLGMTGQRNANQLSAISGLVDTGRITGELGLQKAGLVDQYNLGLGGLDLSKASGLDQFNLQNAALGASSSAASRAAQADMEKWLLSQQLKGKELGIGGLDDLYKFNVGATKGYDDLNLNAINSKYGTNQGYSQLMIGNKDKGFDWGKVAGIAGGIGGAFLGGPAGAMAGYNMGSRL